ncbi:MAG: glycosyltransferase [Gammaproteobacteria bacterium]|nr:glycosyltransferase [Gammaproteobacteria bacterium]
MNVLHVIRGLTNSSGTTHIVIPLAEEQARQGARVSVLFVDKPPHESLIPTPDLVDSQAFPQSLPRLLPLSHPGVSWPFARALKRRIHDFDVVHIHAVWNFPTWWTMRVASRANVPYMVAPQGSLEPWAYNHGSRRRRMYARYMERPLLARATRLQALTETEAEQFRAFGLAVPTAIIPNGISPDWLEGERGNLAAHLDLPPKTRTLLFLSRMHEKKGLDILLRAFAEVSRGFPNLMLVVAGSDAGSGHGDRMRVLANALGLEDRCLFIGEVGGDKKRKVLLGADAFALTSHSEGLPVAVLEAMASGLPVLITPGCNLPEVASSNAGLIVKPSVAAVATGLQTMFGEPHMHERGENGRTLVRERFTWPRIARDTLAVYEDMVSR